MKNSIMQFATRAFMIFALLNVVVFFNGCSDDEDTGGGTTTVVEDGVYVTGSSTAYEEFNIKNLFSVARNEVLQEDRATLVEAYVALTAAGGFNIVEVSGSDRTTWGPGSDFADVAGGTDDQPNVTFQRGSIEQSTTTFSVPSDGLYHVAFDTEIKVAVIVPVSSWGLIGAATPGGWSADTELTPDGFDTEKITFSVSEVPMTVGDFKFRYSGGWKVELDATYDNGMGNNMGIKVNANFGNAVDDLIPGGDNISLAQSGYYDAQVEWVAGSGYTATLTRTGDLPSFDYSSTELGMIGDGLNDNGAQHNWDSPLQLQVPVKNGDIYTWTYSNIQVNTIGGGFKIREGMDWSGFAWGFNDVVMTGDGAGDFSANGDGNFVPAVDGANYDFTYTIDAANDTRTLDADKL